MMNVDKLIKEALLARDAVRVRVLRALKTELINEEKSASKNKVDEIGILRRLIKSRNKSIEAYVKANREDLANEEYLEINILKEFLPVEITEEEITNTFLLEVENGLELSNRNRGEFMKRIKIRFPNVNMGIASKILNNLLNG